jgi:Protein of unknown function (DUF3604)
MQDKGVSMHVESQMRHVAVALAAAGLFTMAITPAFAQKKNPLRDAYFGETHLHTSWSFDAYIFGNLGLREGSDLNPAGSKPQK